RQTVSQVPSMLERLAYRDMWVGGIDTYLDMLYPRLQLMKRLLSDRGSIYVHIGSDASHYVRILMDEIFGAGNHRNEVSWKRFNFHADARRFGRVVDHILFYTKTDEYFFNPQFAPYTKQYVADKFVHHGDGGRVYRLSDLNPPGGRGPVYEFHGITRAWRFKQERMLELEANGYIYAPAGT